ncbi:hypothetical protein [Dehalogenimonas sp. 4OHTPN]|uniref:Uncharacterized protein n=1 Tax=Dehalogenimonas sp. 4OHTPN TaxID=3166643 RepID=A0AAU8GAK1_9CHLR
MNHTEMRNLVRQDLKDTIPATYRWTDDTLDRHVRRAVAEYSAAAPRQMKTAFVTVLGCMELDISSLLDRTVVLGVEYPIDLKPRKFRPYTVWADRLTLENCPAPDGGDLAVYWGCLHTLDASSTTIPSQHHDLIAAGAAAYAAIEWAAYAVNRINSGSNAAADYLRWGKERMSVFRDELRRLSRRSEFRAGKFFRPVEDYSCPDDTHFWG